MVTPHSPEHDAVSVQSSDFVSREEGERVKATIGAKAFCECSAMKRQGVNEVSPQPTVDSGHAQSRPKLIPQKRLKQ